jgi:hypothetical protein
MVKRSTDAVHVAGPIKPYHPAFPQGLAPPPAGPPQATPQNWEKSCAQTAIIPTNSVSDANAAASSTKILSMSDSLIQEHNENIVPYLFQESRRGDGSIWEMAPKEMPWLTALALRENRRINSRAAKLDEFRGEGLLLEQKTQKAMNPFEYGDWQKQIDQWQNETAAYLGQKAYLGQNMGSSYEGGLLDALGRIAFNYGYPPEFNHQMNGLVNHGKNLQEIMDARDRAK